MVENGNSRTLFDIKLNLSYLMKPLFFVLFWSVYDGNFGQIMLEVTEALLNQPVFLIAYKFEPKKQRLKWLLFLLLTY